MVKPFSEGYAEIITEVTTGVLSLVSFSSGPRATWEIFPLENQSGLEGEESQ